MHILQIVIKGQAGALQFFFRGEKSAVAAYGSVSFDGQFQVVDDYGNTSRIDGVQMAAVMLKELSGELEAGTEISLAQARSNASLQRKASADPMLKTLANGPMTLPPVRQ